MKSRLVYAAAITAMLFGLPLAGVLIFGADVCAYLEFPPRTRYVEHAPFSWLVFIGLATVILAVMLPFLVRIGKAHAPNVPRNVDERTTRRVVRSFPWWGWLAVILGILSWVLAWTRFAWVEPLQLYTFSPLWFCYIAAVNALTLRRTGRCLLTHDTKFFLALFGLSAAFWWFFEYLNRFVQNWYYVGCDHFSPLQYFVMATLPFSTVLPAILSTEEWLASHPRCHAGLDRFLPLHLLRSKAAVGLLLTASAAGLFLIGVFPNQLYPLVWVAPLLLLAAFQRLANRPAFFPEVEQGDWRRVFRFALAALVCGFFWEMWNIHSLAQWIYTVPYVHRFQLFEMPLLGYAGYLPFGLECAVIASLIKPHSRIIP
jgi:hypothetical protein